MRYHPPTDDFVNFTVALTSSSTRAVDSSSTAATKTTTATTSSTIATTSVSNDNSTPAPSSNPPTQPTGSGLSIAVIGAIVGAVLGGILLISFIAFIIIYKRRGRTAGAEKLKDESSLEMTSREKIIRTRGSER